MQHIFELEIEKLIYGGSGLGRHQGKVVFVPFSVPGDRLMVRTVREKKNFIHGETIEILHSGPGRIPPACLHFGKCGGCHWQHIEYPLQVETKLNILEETFHHRFPKTRDIQIGMKACPQPFSYRSRARVQVRRPDSQTTVGFFRPGSHSVEPIKNCPLFRPPLNQALDFLRDSGTGTDIDTGIQAFDIAGSYEDDLWAVTPAPDISTIKKNISQADNSKEEKDVLLKRKVGKFLYSVSAPLFFQANDFMTSALVRLALEMAEATTGESALDLFAGVGLFSLPMAGLFKSVTAIENSPAASKLCSQNATIAGVDNVQTICADVADWMNSAHSGTPPRLDLILLDPPRSGAGHQIMDQILSLQPRTILYVSCDPQTLVRDLSRVSWEEYKIDRVEGLDMFPQTFHFETIVRLERIQR